MWLDDYLDQQDKAFRTFEEGKMLTAGRMPRSKCESCGAAGECITSLRDEYYQYMCCNLECPSVGLRWQGRRMQDAERADAQARFDALRTQLSAGDDTILF